MVHYRDGYQGGVQKYNFSMKSIGRGLLLLLTPIIAYTIVVLKDMLLEQGKFYGGTPAKEVSKNIE